MVGRNGQHNPLKGGRQIVPSKHRDGDEADEFESPKG